MNGLVERDSQYKKQRDFAEKRANILQIDNDRLEVKLKRATSRLFEFEMDRDCRDHADRGLCKRSPAKMDACLTCDFGTLHNYKKYKDKK